MAESDGDRGSIDPADREPAERADRSGPSPEPAADGFAATADVPPENEDGVVDRVAPTPTERDEANTHSMRRRRRRKVIGWSMVGVGVFILAGAAWVGWRGYQAYTHLETASADVSTMQDQLQDVTTTDPEALSATVNHLQAEAAAARSAVDDPLFRAARVVPILGANIDAIREITLTVDSLATDVMPSLVDIAQTLQPSELTPTDGAINLEPIERISPLLQHADAAVNQAIAKVAAIDRSAVLQPVGDAVITLWHKLDKAAEVTGPGARVARLLPPMLGSDGIRKYLVVFQNLAEPRATGGIFGSFALITVDRGKISIIDQGASSRRLKFFDPPVAELSENEIHLYTELMAQYPMDVNFTPDFPTAAPLFAEMYRLRTGTTADGVLAIDPVALSYMLKGRQPIDIGDGVAVTADNLVPILLSNAYEKFGTFDEQDARDVFLASATSRVFTEVMSGNGNARSIVDGLRKAAGERRVMIYSAHPTEQADIATTGVSGAIDPDRAAPSIGVFLNDGTGAKLGYYLTSEVQVTEGECRTDGRRELSVKVVMHYDAPADGLPAYVIGSSDLGKAYTLRTNLLLFAPTGGGIVDATRRDGAPIEIGHGVDHSRDVGTTTVDLTPGTSTELVFTVLGPAGVLGSPTDVPPTLVLTPGITPWVTSVDSYRDCTAATG